MKDWKIFLIAILILVIIGQWFINYERDIEQNLGLDKAKSEKLEAEKRITALEAISDTLITKLKQDSAKAEIVRLAQRKDIERLKIKVSVTRKVKEVQTVIDSTPQVAEAFEADDSLTLMYMHAIDTCEAQKINIYKDFTDVIKTKDSIISNIKIAASKSDSIISDQEKKISKGKRREKVLKIMIPVAFIIGILVGL